jgi:hypothetical protein
MQAGDAKISYLPVRWTDLATSIKKKKTEH